MAYLPIESHGCIGNMRTAALVGLDGTIDWFCYPRFDSASVFASILDDAKGGHFRLAPVSSAYTSKQFYWPETNVLVTRFLSPQGIAEIEDFMPLARHGGDPWHNPIVRRVSVLQGAMTFDMECLPAFDYARTRHATTLVNDGTCAVFEAPGCRMALHGDSPLSARGRGGVGARFTLQESERATFLFRGLADHETTCGPSPSPTESTRLLESTIAYWQRWLRGCTYVGRWREWVHRSALTLKLLTHESSGAIVAAPTCGLPESIGGERNWDYRYVWVRDAAFTIYAFLRIGFAEEAAAFMAFLDKRYCEGLASKGVRAAGDGARNASGLGSESPLGLLFTLDGKREAEEFLLGHFEGHRKSRPVRVGNAAYAQLQLDVYGELLDAVYLFNKYGRPLSYDSWKNLRGLVDWVEANWEKPDEGIWEPRSGRRHYTHSKLMCWVALDRALRLADKRSFPAPRERWARTRDAIFECIFEQGWSDERQAFTQTLGGNTLDASLLLMPLVLFVSGDDPRMVKTVDAIRRSPSRGGLAHDGLVWRYDSRESPDGFDDAEGSFNMCSFWLVEAMTRAGQHDKKMLSQARLLFEKMLGFGNGLGLFSEQTGASGEALGNFPQAFTHLALISAAFNLNRALGT